MSKKEKSVNLYDSENTNSELKNSENIKPQIYTNYLPMAYSLIE